MCCQCVVCVCVCLSALNECSNECMFFDEVIDSGIFIVCISVYFFILIML